MSDKDNNKDDFLFEDDDELSSFMSELDDSNDKKKESDPAAEPKQEAAAEPTAEPEIVEEPDEPSFSRSTEQPSASKSSADDFDFSWDDDDDDDFGSSFSFDSNDMAKESDTAVPESTAAPADDAASSAEPEADFTDSFAAPSSDEPKLDFEADAEGESDYYSNDVYQESGSGFMGGLSSFCANNSRILVVVGIAVAAIIGFKWFFSPTSDQKKLLSAPKPNPIHEVAPPKPEPVVAPASQQPSVSQKRLDSMNSALRGNKSDLNALHSQMTRLQTRFSSTNHNLQELSTQLHQLQATNQQLVAQVKLIEQREQDRLKKQQYKETHYVHYHVQALEEGRAWLMGSNGLLTSVSVGSRLEHYGEVLSIDVDNAAVITSSGETIHYKHDAMNSKALR